MMNDDDDDDDDDPPDDDNGQIDDLVATTPKLTWLLESLRSGKSLSEMRRSLDTVPERELCRRAALVRVFDRQLFDSVLAVGLDLAELDTAFDHLINRPGIECIPRTEGLYRLKDVTRREYLLAWTTEAADVRDQTEFGHTLVAYYQSRPDAQLDLLSSLLMVDQGRARELFISLYDEADRRFDLPVCQTLLRIIEERETLLDIDLHQALNDKQRYYHTRSLFATEYYQTVSYYPRDTVRREFESLLQHSSKWIFHLYATGGMGKTMFLRWLLARYCAVEPQRIPVALLDFDFIHLPLVNNYPWLLLQPLAAQLNEQIAGRPFYELVESPTGLRELTPLLRQMMSEEHQWRIKSDEDSSQRQNPIWQEFYEAQRQEREQVERKLQSSADFWSQYALSRFRNTLAESSLTGPVVIILDTLEEMTTAEQAALIKTLEYFAAIHEAYPRVRLILSGRYDLRERIPEFNQLYAPLSDCFELGRFTREESIGYLTQKRHLADQGLLEAIYERADNGNPFKLALFADMVSAKEASGEPLKPQDVLDFPSADYAYLIERIVERVAEPEVRWALRYGVIPRRLSHEFFERVMLPYLKSEIAQSRLDYPAERWPEEARIYEGRLIWPNQSLEEERLATAEIWRRLRHYASSYGWVTYEAQSDSFVFHPDVRLPMRRLLRQQEVFWSLQECAVDYFQRREREDRHRWMLWVSEVVYHLSQLDVDRASQYLEDKLNSPEAGQDPAARKQLAKEVLKQDYIEEAVFSRRLEAKALTIAARASIALAWDGKRRNGEWNDARRLFDLLERRHPDQLTGPDRLLSQIADYLTSNQLVEAIAPCEKLLRDEISGELRQSLELQLADLMALYKRSGADAHYVALLDQISRQPPGFVPAYIVRLGLAAFYTGAERFADAEREYLMVLKADLSDAESQATLFRLAELNFDYAQFEKAAEYARQALDLRPPNMAAQFQFYYLAARIELACYNPMLALNHLQSASLPEGDSELLAMKCELLGAIYGQLMNFAQAISLLEEAKRIWGDIGNELSQDRCRLRMAEIQLHGIGNFKEARECLAAWQEFSRHEPSETELRLELLSLTLYSRYGYRADQQKEWQHLLSLEWVKNSPRLKALTLGTALALELATDIGGAELFETLRQIEPSTARLAALEPFRLWRVQEITSDRVSDRVASPVEVDRMIKDKFLALFQLVTPDSDPTPERIFIRQALLASDLYRWLGVQSLAEKLLELAEQRAHHDLSGFTRRALFCARDRWEQRGWTSEIKLVLPRAISDQFRMLEAVIALEHAERLFRRQYLSEIENCLIRAENLLDKAIPTQWGARAMLLRSRLLWAKGDRERAEEFLLSAAGIYERLDDRIAPGRLRRAVAGLTVEPSLDLEIDFNASLENEDENILSDEMIERPAYLIDFEVDDGGQQYLRSNLLPGQPSLRPLGPVKAWATIYSDNPRSLQFEQSALEMGKFLLSAEEMEAITLHSEYETADLQLSIPPVPVSAIPWELAWVQLPDGRKQFLTAFFRSVSRTTKQTSVTREAVKWGQVAANQLLKQEIKVDGIYGPRTWTAISELQRRLGIKRAHGRLDRETVAEIRRALRERTWNSRLQAVVVQSSEGLAIKGARGYSRYTLDVSEIYQRYRCAALDAGMEGLADFVIESNPQILHFVVTMEESTHSGEISINLGDRSYFTAGHINSTLKRLPDDRMRPLVIIDVIRPPGAGEATRQLLLRNQFATHLFHKENTGGIIGTGLAPPEQEGELLDLLISGLTQGNGLGEVISAIHSMKGGGLGYFINGGQLAASQYTTLFSLDPALSIVPHFST